MKQAVIKFLSKLKEVKNFSYDEGQSPYHVEIIESVFMVIEEIHDLGYLKSFAQKALALGHDLPAYIKADIKYYGKLQK